MQYAKILLCLLLFSLVFTGCSERDIQKEAPPKVKNIILIVIDTLRAANLGFMGYNRPTSPFIDELSQQCAVFEKAYTPRAQTLPAFTSLYTGQHVLTHGVVNNGTLLPNNIHFLVEDLREAGFLTVGFPASKVIKGKFGINRGFDYYTDLDRMKKLRLPASMILESVRQFIDGDSSKGVVPYPGEVQPVFLMVHFFDVHDPYKPSLEFKAQFVDPDYDGILADVDDDMFDEIQKAHNGFELDFTDADVRHATDLYDAGIRTIDEHLRELFGMFEEAGLMGNSLIIFTADHGENLCEHHALGHGHAYEDGLHIPLMFHFPKDFAAGRRINTLVEIHDILPTAMETAGIPYHQAVDGQSLLPLIGGLSEEEWSRNYVLARGAGKKDVENPPYSIFDGVHRLSSGIEWSETSLLYDITADPHEGKDIAADNQKMVEFLESIITLIVAGLEPPDIVNAVTGHTPKIQEMDPETEEELRSLGYLD